MKDLEAYAIRAIQERAMTAIHDLQAIVDECERLYQSRRYIIAKAEDALVHAKAISAIATEETDG